MTHILCVGAFISIMTNIYTYTVKFSMVRTKYTQLQGNNKVRRCLVCTVYCVCNLLIGLI